MPKDDAYRISFQEVKTLAGDFTECRWGDYKLGYGRNEYEAAKMAVANINDIVVKLRAAGFAVDVK